MSLKPIIDKQKKELADFLAKFKGAISPNTLAFEKIKSLHLQSIKEVLTELIREARGRMDKTLEKVVSPQGQNYSRGYNEALTDSITYLEEEIKQIK